jgi:hypothetical protein
MQEQFSKIQRCHGSDYEVFRTMTLCSLTKTYRRFGRTCHMSVRQQLPPKRYYIYIKIHGSISQNTVFLKNSNVYKDART